MCSTNAGFLARSGFTMFSSRHTGVQRDLNSLHRITLTLFRPELNVDSCSQILKEPKK